MGARRDGDDDFAAGVASFEIADGFGNLTQWVGSVDHGSYFSALHEVGDGGEICGAGVSQDAYEFAI